MDYRQFYWNLGGGGGLWFIPVCAGIMAILFGILILIVPDLLAYIVACMLILAGCSMLGVGWHWRTRVTIRRLGDDDPPPGQI